MMDMAAEMDDKNSVVTFVVLEPLLQWSLGDRVTPPATGTPVKITMTESPCSGDVKVLAVQFSAGYIVIPQTHAHTLPAFL